MDGFSFFWGRTVPAAANRSPAQPVPPAKPRVAPTVVVRRPAPTTRPAAGPAGLPKFLTTPGG